MEKNELSARCTDHPAYGGKRSPRTHCPMCWHLYNSNRVAKGMPVRYIGYQVQIEEGLNNENARPIDYDQAGEYGNIENSGPWDPPPAKEDGS